MQRTFYVRLVIDTTASPIEAALALQAMIDSAEPVADVPLVITSAAINADLGKLLGWPCDMISEEK